MVQLYSMEQWVYIKMRCRSLWYAISPPLISTLFGISLSSPTPRTSVLTFSIDLPRIVPTDTMSPTPIPAFEEHESIIWPVQSFTVDHDFKSPHPAHLLLDRANSEFGLIYQIAPRVAIMAQFPDSDEPVFFQVSRTRAACSREGHTCKKVCVLVHHLQIDLEFATADNASDFMHMLGRLATKVGNLEFEVYEAQSYVKPRMLPVLILRLTGGCRLGALNRPEFNIEKMCIEEDDAPQSWSSVRNADTFDWAGYVSCASPRPTVLTFAASTSLANARTLL
jgi:hypothetical protein